MTEGGITQWVNIPTAASTFANEVGLEFESMVCSHQGGCHFELKSGVAATLKTSAENAGITGDVKVTVCG